jgi:uncharacterized DUF497 family protein
VADAIEFDWDTANITHLARHGILAGEVEEVFSSDVLDLEYQNEEGEDRFRSVGVTSAGRVLVIVWTVRERRLRPITGWTANPSLRKLFVARMAQGDR